MPKYKSYVQGKYGEWYGVDKYGGKFLDRSYNPNKVSKTTRAYNPGRGRAGFVSIPERLRTLFPKEMFEKKTRGGYRIKDSYTKGYKGQKGFGWRNPYSPLSIKINGAQKKFGYQTPKKFLKSGLTFAWFRLHLIRVIEKLEVNAQNFSVILSLRAQKIFQDSFKNKSADFEDGSGPWEQLADSTIRKRIKRKTWPGRGGMLREYGILFDSIKVKKDKDENFKGGVYTDSSEYASRRNRRSIPFYARLHNEGGKIRGGHYLPRRQFIGHSRLLFDFALKNADRYFFFNVFD